ncbi:helix-turn-helix domain-containing protein [Xanthobacter autotrophicus]|uniref:helix-turn-helix domain-containing protein n=1 Tax=Xanthobacter autotrophicus TaxID=280 RepID=UPI0037269FC9
MGSTVPAYALYGEGSDGFPDELHVETIVARSSIHEWRIRSHRHGDLYQFFFIASGGGVASIDGATHVLRPGSAVVLPPLVVHSFDFEAGTDGYVASVPPAVLDRASTTHGQWRSALARPAVIAAEPEAASRLSQMLALAHAEFADARAGRTEALTAFAGLVLVWFRRAIAAVSPDGVPGGASVQRRLFERFRAQVEEDFRRHPSLADRARRLGVSAPHLSRVCRQMVGRSALGVVQERMVLEARRHLLYTSMTVSEIAFLLGFTDPAYFTRLFTRHVGQSPSAYRDAFSVPSDAAALQQLGTGPAVSRRPHRRPSEG